LIRREREGGWTLIELVVTMTVMAVLAMGVLPLIQTAVRRQKEQQLREDLREMREAIKEFRRDTMGMQCNAGLGGADSVAPNPNAAPNVPGQQGVPSLVDPRSKVVIGDCTIFTVDNPDHYPPDLDTLVNGVNVVPRTASQAQTTGSVQGNMLDRQSGGALATKKKIYLREIPVDPMTGEKKWVVCSSWETQDAHCSGKENAFDVRSASDAPALNGKDKYSDW
jgi:general secretion pathway protein G